MTQFFLKISLLLRGHSFEVHVGVKIARWICARPILAFLLLGFGKSPRHFHVKFAHRFALLKHLRGGQLARPCNLGDFFFAQTNHHIFRFEISVDNLANAVHVVEANETLASKTSRQGHWNSLVVVPLYDFEEIYSEDFKNHNEVLAVGPIMDKRVQQLNAVGGVP